jgi:hypothetical protein
MKAAPATPAQRPTVRQPSHATSGMVAVPRMSDGSRMRAGSPPSLRLSQASVKNSGGEFSGPE